MPSEILVEMKGVGKVFSSGRAPALSDISAVIPKGKIVGLVGPDGSGKTTLIRLIAGLLLPTSGEIIIEGYDSVKDAEYIRKIIGYMPQKFGLYEDLTVMQNLLLYADLKGIVGEERKQIFQKLLRFTDLAPFTDRLAGNLSGGMKQKLGLACTLINTPDLLLLDEPSVGVDPISRRELWKMVHALLAEGISVIWSTAYLDEAERCDTVLLLNEGLLLFDGPPKSLTEKIKDRVVKISGITVNKREALSEILKEPNIIDGTIQGSDIRAVFRKEAKPYLSISQTKFGEPIRLQPALPRFEDAFIDILGGAPSGTSSLAERTNSIVNNEEKVIVAQELTKKFGNFTAADHISFEVAKGEIFGLLGPNGAGKSTTFKMMCGLLPPTSGKATVNGLDLQTAPGAGRSQIGYMAQKFSLYGNLSVLENLRFFSGIYNLSGKAKRDAVNEMIEIFNFQEYLNESSETIPLGFKQRLALSCAVMHRPKVLFLDEPTSGVDPVTRREFWNHMNGLVEKGVTIMVTTHFMDEAEYCDRIGLIYRSKLIRTGTPDTIKKEAQSPENPNPGLEDAFINLIEQYDRTRPPQ